MRTYAACIKDEGMVVYMEQAKRRYGSYAGFIRSLIIDRMERGMFREEEPQMIYTRQSIVEERIAREPIKKQEMSDRQVMNEELKSMFAAIKDKER